MAASTQSYKGARDFYPDDVRLQKYIFAKWREACERFGYEEHDAPILESAELYLSKPDEEAAVEQLYSFVDRDGHNIAVRTEWTPSIGRMIAAKRNELAYPVRAYATPQCWRYESTQRGHGREFYQLNADLFGAPGVSAEHEAIQLADTILQSFGAKRSMYTIKINSRRLVEDMFGGCLGLGGSQTRALIRLIDRMYKADPAAFAKQVDTILTPTQREAGVAKKLLSFLKSSSVRALPAELRQSQSLAGLNALLATLQDDGITNVEFDPSLMRGFDYYTGIVFEVFDNHSGNKRSMFGGGRYDTLVGTFGVEHVPATGFAMPDTTLIDFLETHDLLPAFRPETDVYVVLVGDVVGDAQRAIREMRDMGINVAVDLSGRSSDNQIKAAVEKGVTYVIVIGEKELADEQFELRNLAAGTSERRSLARIASIVKDYRLD